MARGKRKDSGNAGVAATDYSSLTVAKLKAELKSRGHTDIPTRKAELISTLQQLDKASKPPIEESTEAKAKKDVAPPSPSVVDKSSKKESSSKKTTTPTASGSNSRDITNDTGSNTGVAAPVFDGFGPIFGSAPTQSGAVALTSYTLHEVQHRDPVPNIPPPQRGSGKGKGKGRGNNNNNNNSNSNNSNNSSNSNRRHHPYQQGGKGKGKNGGNKGFYMPPPPGSYMQSNQATMSNLQDLFHYSGPVPLKPATEQTKEANTRPNLGFF